MNEASSAVQSPPLSETLILLALQYQSHPCSTPFSVWMNNNSGIFAADNCPSACQQHVMDIAINSGLVAAPIVWPYRHVCEYIAQRLELAARRGGFMEDEVDCN